MIQQANGLEVLQAARELIADEDHWCQDHFALAANQDATDPSSPYATRWCATGALTNVADSYEGEQRALEALLEVVGTELDKDGSEAVIEFNDSHSHSEVVGLFDEAIEYAQQRMVAT